MSSCTPIICTVWSIMAAIRLCDIYYVCRAVACLFQRWTAGPTAGRCVIGEANGRRIGGKAQSGAVRGCKSGSDSDV
jgi:hypothetical protein